MGKNITLDCDWRGCESSIVGWSMEFSEVDPSDGEWGVLLDRDTIVALCLEHHMAFLSYLGPSPYSLEEQNQIAQSLVRWVKADDEDAAE